MQWTIVLKKIQKKIIFNTAHVNFIIIFCFVLFVGSMMFFYIKSLNNKKEGKVRDEALSIQVGLDYLHSELTDKKKI